MTISDEELLISRPPQCQQKRSPPSRAPPKSIRIECQAEERHFINSPPLKISASIKPIRFTMDNQVKPGQYRSEIVVQNNPDVDLYIKRLRIAFHAHDDLSINTNARTPRTSSRSHSLHVPSQQKQGKYRSVSLPRSNSQAVLHQWIDDICSNEKLMGDEDICFFIKNGEFLARI
jgi:hypothetical protein